MLGRRRRNVSFGGMHSVWIECSHAGIRYAKNQPPTRPPLLEKESITSQKKSTHEQIQRPENKPPTVQLETTSSSTSSSPLGITNPSSELTLSSLNANRTGSSSSPMYFGRSRSSLIDTISLLKTDNCLVRQPRRRLKTRVERHVHRLCSCISTFLMEVTKFVTLNHIIQRIPRPLPRFTVKQFSQRTPPNET